MAFQIQYDKACHAIWLIVKCKRIKLSRQKFSSLQQLPWKYKPLTDFLYQFTSQIGSVPVHRGVRYKIVLNSFTQIPIKMQYIRIDSNI